MILPSVVEILHFAFAFVGMFVGISNLITSLRLAFYISKMNGDTRKLTTRQYVLVDSVLVFIYMMYVCIGVLALWREPAAQSSHRSVLWTTIVYMLAMSATISISIILRVYRDRLTARMLARTRVGDSI